MHGFCNALSCVFVHFSLGSGERRPKEGENQLCLSDRSSGPDGAQR